MAVKRTLPNILITGANGQLGSSLALLCNSKDAKFFFTDVNELDITSKSAVNKFIAEKKIDLVINCAAYTNVAKAQTERALATKLNVAAVENLAKVCKSHGAFLIHVSTDYIFDGKRKTPISERVKPAPLNVYGETKFKGEQKIIESGCKYLIIRTSWLYSEFGNNFVKTMLNLLSTREEIKVVNDQIGTPTYAGDLAKAVYKIALQVIDSDTNIKSGIFNYSNMGECSWYEFAVKIQALSKVKVNSTGRKCRITPCTSDQFPTPVVRPAYSVLSKAKIQRSFSLAIPTWQSSLSKCLKKGI